MGLHPGQQRTISDQADELQQAAPNPLAVVPQVVAIEQRDRPRADLHAGPQQSRQRAVYGAAGAPGAGRIQVGRQLRKIQLQLVMGIQVVAGLGHGEGDDAGIRIRPHRDHVAEVGLVGQHRADGRDAGVAAFALGRDGLQRIGAATGLQRGNDVRHVRPCVAAHQHPSVVPQQMQLVQVHGLVGAVKRSQSDVQNDVRHRRVPAHAAAPTTRPWASKRWALDASIATPTRSPACSVLRVFRRATRFAPGSVVT